MFVASGDSFADALSGVPTAHAAGSADVLVRPADVPDAVASLLEAMRQTAVTVLGGTAAVSRSVEVDLAATMRD